MFNDPDALNIYREHGRLLSFGGELHYFLGYRLAMLELEAALGTLLARLPQLRLMGVDDLRGQPRNTLRGVEALQAAW